MNPAADTSTEAVRSATCSASYCPDGADTNCTAILVVHAVPSDLVADVKQTLRNTGAFTTVDFFDARAVSNGGSGATPSAAQLSAYHAVLVFTNGYSVFSDSALLGDRLAAFHDQGGGVVVAAPANENDSGTGFSLKGAYAAVENGYALLSYSQGQIASPLSSSLGDVLEPDSPLMAGVTSLSAVQAWRSSAPVVAGRAVVVARWSTGEPLVLRGTRGGRTLVELNLHLVSSAWRWDQWTGDGALLMRNALKYSRCMPSGGSFAVSSGGSFAAAGNLSRG